MADKDIWQYEIPSECDVLLEVNDIQYITTLYNVFARSQLFPNTTKALYGRYKAFVATVQGLCSDRTRPL